MCDVSGRLDHTAAQVVNVKQGCLRLLGRFLKAEIEQLRAARFWEAHTWDNEQKLLTPLSGDNHGMRMLL